MEFWITLFQILGFIVGGWVLNDFFNGR